MGAMIAKLMGVEGIPIAVYPGIILNDPPEVFDRRVEQHVLPEVFAGLLGTRAATGPVAQHDDGYDPGAVAVRGTIDELLDEFIARQWTDGLPVVPPTRERVAAFLDHVERDPDEVLGVLLPANREATVYNVAVNGVMAGCRPEYMPILVAIVEAVADPTFRVQD